MSVFFAMRKGDALHPADVESAGLLSKVTPGKIVRIEVRAPRSGAFHRKYWLLCARIGDAVGVDSENISDLLKIETGHCTIVKSKTYGELRLPRSISYAAMDNAAFSIFFERCVQVICETWGIAKPDVLAAVEDLLVPTERAA